MVNRRDLRLVGFAYSGVVALVGAIALFVVMAHVDSAQIDTMSDSPAASVVLSAR